MLFARMGFCIGHPADTPRTGFTRRVIFATSFLIFSSSRYLTHPAAARRRISQRHGSSHRSCTRVTDKSEREGKKRERWDRPPRHVNEFFKGRAGRAETIDKRLELEVRESREAGLVWQRGREKEKESKKRRGEKKRERRGSRIEGRSQDRFPSFKFK